MIKSVTRFGMSENVIMPFGFKDALHATHFSCTQPCFYIALHILRIITLTLTFILETAKAFSLIWTKGLMELLDAQSWKAVNCQLTGKKACAF